MSTRIITRFALLGLALGVYLALSGCASKVNRANVDKINPGMSEQEVAEILGSPSESNRVAAAKHPPMKDGDTSFTPPPRPEVNLDKYSVWRDGEKEIRVEFLLGKVVGKSVKGLPEAAKDDLFEQTETVIVTAEQEGAIPTGRKGRLSRHRALPRVALRAMLVSKEAQ